MSPRASWPPTAGGRLRPGVARIVVAAAVGVLVALLGVWLMPRVPSLSTQMTGDRDLAAESRPYLDGALDVVSIATVDGATINYAGFGADETAVYEIGSITKTFTSALLADAISRGEVTADTRLADLLPVRETPVADVTLAELASHRSGLPRVGTSPTIRENLRLLTHRDRIHPESRRPARCGPLGATEQPWTLRVLRPGSRPARRRPRLGGQHRLSPADAAAASSGRLA